MKEIPLDIKVKDLHTIGDIEAEYIVGHEELNRELSEPELQELLYLIEDTPED